MGDRKKPQQGDTALIQPGVIRLTNWEVAEPTCCEKLGLCLKCSWADLERSYIYSRDNHSIEVNDTNGKRNCCTWCSAIQDNVSVYYYDRDPFKDKCMCTPCSAWFCCMFFYCDDPKLDVVDEGYWCCCVKINCENCGCGGKKVVLIPFENLPPPCCCCTNRTNCCDNCCSLMGPASGNPRFYSDWSPNAADPVAFVAAHRAVKDGVALVAAVPVGVEMSRT